MRARSRNVINRGDLWSAAALTVDEFNSVFCRGSVTITFANLEFLKANVHVVMGNLSPGRCAVRKARLLKFYDEGWFFFVHFRAEFMCDIF